MSCLLACSGMRNAKLSSEKHVWVSAHHRTCHIFTSMPFHAYLWEWRLSTIPHTTLCVPMYIPGTSPHPAFSAGKQEKNGWVKWWWHNMSTIESKSSQKIYSKIIYQFVDIEFGFRRMENSLSVDRMVFVLLLLVSIICVGEGTNLHLVWEIELVRCYFSTNSTIPSCTDSLIHGLAMQKLR